MSAYFCNKKTFGIVVSGLIADRKSNRFFLPPKQKATFEELLNDGRQLYIKLQQLNNYALAERYGLKAVEQIDTSNPVAIIYQNKKQIIEAVKELIYQCSEGNAINEDLYKLLQRYEHSLLDRYYYEMQS